MAQLGKTKVFMKAEAFLHLEKLRKDALQGSAEIVQAWSRALTALSAVRKVILEANVEMLNKVRAEVLAELAEKKRQEEADRLANAEKYAAEERERAERELAERMANASAFLLKDEDEGRAAVAAEEDAAWAALLAAEATEHATHLAAMQRWTLEKAEETARRAIELDEEEANFDIASYGMKIR